MATQQSPVIRLALLGIVSIGLLYAVQGLGQVTLWINQLPIEGSVLADSPDGAPGPALATSNDIHPLLVESSLKAAALHTGAEASSVAMVSLDKLFGRRLVVPVEAATPVQATAAPAIAGADDSQALGKTVRLQALTLNGAIINGRYFVVGETVLSAPYFSTSAHKWEHPVLSAVFSQGVSLRLAGPGQKLLLVKLPD